MSFGELVCQNPGIPSLSVYDQMSFTSWLTLHRPTTRILPRKLKIPISYPRFYPNSHMTSSPHLPGPLHLLIDWLAPECRRCIVDSPKPSNPPSTRGLIIYSWSFWKMEMSSFFTFRASPWPWDVCKYFSARNPSIEIKATEAAISEDIADMSRRSCGRM